MEEKDEKLATGEKMASALAGGFIMMAFLLAWLLPRIVISPAFFPAFVAQARPQAEKRKGQPEEILCLFESLDAQKHLEVFDDAEDISLDIPTSLHTATVLYSTVLLHTIAANIYNRMFVTRRFSRSARLLYIPKSGAASGPSHSTRRIIQVLPP
jgi:hypothetical protein